MTFSVKPIVFLVKNGKKIEKMRVFCEEFVCGRRGNIYLWRWL